MRSGSSCKQYAILVVFWLFALIGVATTGYFRMELVARTKGLVSQAGCRQDD
jgi:hypothetical protein